MQNKEGIFSFSELSKLRDFCNDCAKEDKKIYEARKKNPSYVPKEEKPEPIKKTKMSSYKNNNNNYGNAKIQKNYINIPKSNNNSKKYSESFQNKLKMFEPKK